MSGKTAQAPWGDPAEEPHHNGQHPSIQQLGAYHRGQLIEEEEEGIRDHFLFCRDCRKLMLELVEFLDGAPRPSRSTGDAIVAAWQELQKIVSRENPGSS
jgi:hypothetical protein